eukprot:CAMPEP_0181291236 /NCGR_PEP_ID=MMETSP1101-20121128/1859_1 /TAXON_ID=46948 /ORGANISM="Rhodomonas abbreviata, Strain Caron Lab Isolate" /LENGTH=220 /DNA_ID=CAMNT_0023395613 /DNA_START=58 /DNA_END=720 /DNA_ORIENTATION=+
MGSSISRSDSNKYKSVMSSDFLQCPPTHNNEAPAMPAKMKPLSRPKKISDKSHAVPSLQCNTQCPPAKSPSSSPFKRHFRSPGGQGYLRSPGFLRSPGGGHGGFLRSPGRSPGDPGHFLRSPGGQARRSSRIRSGLFFDSDVGPCLDYPLSGSGCRRHLCMEMPENAVLGVTVDGDSGTSTCPLQEGSVVLSVGMEEEQDEQFGNLNDLTAVREQPAIPA